VLTGLSDASQFRVLAAMIAPLLRAASSMDKFDWRNVQPVDGGESGDGQNCSGSSRLQN
jgi:hypothetical protein